LLALGIEFPAHFDTCQNEIDMHRLGSNRVVRLPEVIKGQNEKQQSLRIGKRLIRYTIRGNGE